MGDADNHDHTSRIAMILTAVLTPSKVTFTFPEGLLQAGTAMTSLGALLLIILGAVLVGNEYGYDTWKNLLTRHSGRAVFILGKWGAMAITLAFGALVLLVFAQVLGLVLEATLRLTGAPIPLSLGTALLLVGTQTLAPLVAGSFAMMGAVLGRSSVAGIIVGIVWFIADSLLSTVLPGVTKLITFGVASSSLQASILGAVSPLSIFPSLVVVLVYLVAPIAIAVLLFRRRDMVGIA